MLHRTSTHYFSDMVLQMSDKKLRSLYKIVASGTPLSAVDFGAGVIFPEGATEDWIDLTLYQRGSTTAYKERLSIKCEVLNQSMSRISKLDLL